MGTTIAQDERCTVTGCTGLKAPLLDACFVHADDAGFALAFQQANRDGEVNLDLRGVPLTQAAVDRILQACPTGSSGLRLLGNINARGARPTQRLAITGASFGRLHLDKLISDFEVELALTVRDTMTMYNMGCAGLLLHLEGGGKVIADHLRVNDRFALTLGRYTASFRSAPIYADQVFIEPTADSRHARVRVDAFGDDCTVSGGALSRLEVFGAQLERELTIAAIEVKDGIWLNDSTIRDVSLAQCTSGGINLDGIRVAGDLQASRLDLGPIWARNCRVEGEAVFRDVKMSQLGTGRDTYFGMLDLAACTVTEHLEVIDTAFEHLALDNARIARASFSSVVVNGHASLRAAELSGPLLIADSSFAGSLTLNGTAAEDVTLRGVEIADCLGFFRAHVGGHLRLTEVREARIIDLRELRVGGSGDLDVSSDLVDATGCMIAGALRLRAETPMLWMVSTTLMSRGEVECEGPPGQLCALDLQAVEPHERLLIDGRDRTSVIDLRRGRCDGVRLQAVALDRCLFDAATSLEELRLTGESFARRRSRFARGRVVLAEDASFDRDLLPDRDDQLAPEADAVLDERKTASALHMAQRYRSLRKGLEDSRDSAGASEFYFAEMQIRRVDASAGTFERTLLGAYRIFGGYGVRPLAPAAWLVVLLLVATTSASAFGAVNRSSTPAQRIALSRQDCLLRSVRQVTTLSCPASSGVVDVPPAGTERDFGRIMLTVASSAVGFTRTLDSRLEPLGQAIIIGVRLLGALLLGLLLLALRSTVRR